MRLFLGLRAVYFQFPSDFPKYVANLCQRESLTSIQELHNSLRRRIDSLGVQLEGSCPNFRSTFLFSVGANVRVGNLGSVC
jgi:hypothetical protein